MKWWFWTLEYQFWHDMIIFENWNNLFDMISFKIEISVLILYGKFKTFKYHDTFKISDIILRDDMIISFVYYQRSRWYDKAELSWYEIWWKLLAHSGGSSSLNWQIVWFFQCI